MKTILDKVANVWCYTFHREPMWPVQGYYRCPDCLREYPVPWESGQNRFDARQDEDGVKVLRPTSQIH